MVWYLHILQNDHHNKSEAMSVILQLKKLRTAVTTIYWFHVNVGFHSLIQMLGSEMAVL